MFGALAVQLLFSVFRSDGLAICSACGSPFIPKRRPNSTRRVYCPDCSKGRRDQRDASRAYRDRKKMAETLANEGIPTKEIARRVGSPVKTVSGWLEKGGERKVAKSRRSGKS